MGYSGRYHAASLAAVFVALAIGILIGVGLADDVVSSASEELENSLRGERDAALDQVGDLEADVDRESQFSRGAYPALVADRLARQDVAVIEIGTVPDASVDDTATASVAAVEDAGGDVASVSAIELPADFEALADSAGGRFSLPRLGPAALQLLGRAIGGAMIGGGALIDRVKPELFSSFNGDLDDVSRVVVIRNPTDGGDARQRADADAFEEGLLAGLRRRSAAVAGVERTTTDPTTLAALADAGIPTIDHIDLPAGKVSLVYVLDGAEGDFGVKDGASSYLPELLPPPGQ